MQALQDFLRTKGSLHTIMKLVVAWLLWSNVAASRWEWSDRQEIFSPFHCRLGSFQICRPMRGMNDYEGRLHDMISGSGCSLLDRLVYRKLLLANQPQS